MTILDENGNDMTANDTTTFDVLAGILTERFRVPPDDLARETAFEELGIDSLFLVEYLVVVEEDLGIKIEEEAVDPTNSLEQLSTLVDQKLAERSGST